MHDILDRFHYKYRISMQERGLLGAEAMMAMPRYHGQVFEITVIGCTNLRKLEWFTTQDPYVCIEYGTSRFRTRTCTDGGRNPKFQERLSIGLIDGIKEMNLLVWNSNTFTNHDLIGSGKIQLDRLISQGIDDRSWTIFDERNRTAGEVKLFMYCPSLNQPRWQHDPPPRPPLPSPSPSFVHPAPLVCPCCPPEPQGAYLGPSQTPESGFCLHHHHHPFLHYNYPYHSVYPPPYTLYPPPSPSHYPHGPPHGCYPPFP